MNTQITEDYVSFETAKLLKEKGFDVPCDNYYDSLGKTPNESVYGGARIETLDYNVDPFVKSGFPKFKTFSAPTQSMAMKWLREVHNIDIIAYPQYDSIKWTYSAIIFKLSIPCTEIRLNDNKSKKEEACEEAIKYYLENLI